jgi:hypothetical protein
MRASRRTPQEPLGPRSPVTVDDFDFDFTANPNVTPEVINLPDRGLRHREKSPADRDRHRSRRSGHESPLHHHCEPGQRTVPGPADDRQLTRVLNRYSKIDLLCLDELDNAERNFSPTREGRSAVAVASNARSPNGVKPSVTSGSVPRSSTG